MEWEIRILTEVEALVPELHEDELLTTAEILQMDSQVSLVMLRAVILGEGGLWGKL